MAKMRGGPLKGPYMHTAAEKGSHRKVNGQKNVNSQRRARPSNAGAMTGPLKGPDKGMG